MDDLSKILDLGFVRIGSWQLEGENLVFKLHSNRNKTNFLYAFVAGNEVLYIGKSTQSVYRRLMGYKNPGPTQETNFRNNRNIIGIISQGSIVEIYMFEEEKDYTYKGYKLNLAAGLEDTVISELSPKWNLHARK